MDGCDKALVEWNGQPMWRRQLRVLGEVQPSRLLVSARADQAWTKELPGKVEFVPDPPDVDEGPLGAITRCLERVDAPLLALGIDLPEVTSAWLRNELLGRAVSGRGVFFRSAAGFEPLVGLYHPLMLEAMRDALSAGRLSLQQVLASCLASGLVIEVESGPRIEAALRNLNTVDDWRRARAADGSL